MNWSDRLPPAEPEAQVVVLAAEEGESRDRLIERWLRDAHAPGRESWVLDCDAERFGLFAGLETWLLSLLPPDGERRSRYSFLRPTLTETAPAEEAVRTDAR